MLAFVCYMGAPMNQQVLMTLEVPWRSPVVSA